MNKITRLMVMGIILITGATACAKAPAVAATLAPTVTSLPSVTPAPTATEDPFKGLNKCRTWQEAENCPITVTDFERLSDFVKANFEGFPEESMKVSYVEVIPDEDLTDFVLIHALTMEERGTGTGVATETSSNTKKEYIYGSSLSPIGKPYYFMLKENSPTNNYDCWVAVFPVHNADGSVGTYTIVVPPFIFKANYKTPEDRTEVSLREKFEKLPYLPPAYSMNHISSAVLNIDKQGVFINEIYEDTNDPNGERRRLFEEWEETAIIPKELEGLPLFASDLDLVGRVQKLG
jgi:hypothetical protein